MSGEEEGRVGRRAERRGKCDSRLGESQERARGGATLRKSR